MSVVGIVISTPLLKAINTPAEIMRDADIYLKIYFCGCMTQLMYYMTSGIMRGLGDSRTPMIAIIVCAILNIVLDLVFVVYFNMGCAGVAIATVISQAASAVFVVAKNAPRRIRNTLHTPKHSRLSTDMLRKNLESRRTQCNPVAGKFGRPADCTELCELLWHKPDGVKRNHSEVG